jgi:hypothetical protein
MQTAHAAALVGGRNGFGSAVWVLSARYLAGRYRTVMLHGFGRVSEGMTTIQVGRSAAHAVVLRKCSAVVGHQAAPAALAQRWIGSMLSCSAAHEGAAWHCPAQCRGKADVPPHW